MEGVRIGRRRRRDKFFLIYIRAGASSGCEKAVGCLCGPSDPQQVAFPKKLLCQGALLQFFGAGSTPDGLITHRVADAMTHYYVTWCSVMILG